MKLNGWTILAQIVNFLLLVWLLRRFLYEPVRKVIEERGARLERLRKEAEARAEAALAEERAYREKAAGLEAERKRILDEAAAEAERARQRLLEAAQREAAAAREELFERLSADRERLEAEIRSDIIRAACASAEVVLKELAGRSIADAVIEAMEQRLESVAPFGPEPEASESVLEIRTSFEPTGEQKARLVSAVERWLGRPAAGAVFIHDPSLILGVEISGAGESVSWSAREILGSIEAVALASVGVGAPARFGPGDAESDRAGDAKRGAGRGEGGAAAGHA